MKLFEKIVKVRFPSRLDGLTLGGDLYVPKMTGKRPGIVLVSGSGPVDRDGNVKMMMTQMQSNIQKRLALHFTDNWGMSVLSYDKRGIGESIIPERKMLFESTGMNDLVDDAVEAVKYLASLDNVDSSKLLIVGHSEGSIIMPAILEKLSKEYSTTGIYPLGVILLSGLGESIESATAYQRQLLKSELESYNGLFGSFLRLVLSPSKIEQKVSNMYSQVKNTDADFISTGLFGLTKLNAKWWREHLAYNPVEEGKKWFRPVKDAVPFHVFAATGAKDVQARCSFLELDNLKNLLPLATTVKSSIPSKMTHLLRPLEGPPSLLKIQGEYRIQGQEPIDPDLIRDLDDWILSTLKMREQ